MYGKTQSKTPDDNTEAHRAGTELHRGNIFSVVLRVFSEYSVQPFTPPSQNRCIRREKIEQLRRSGDNLPPSSLIFRQGFLKFFPSPTSASTCSATSEDLKNNFDACTPTVFTFSPMGETFMTRSFMLSPTGETTFTHRTGHFAHGRNLHDAQFYAFAHGRNYFYTPNRSFRPRAKPSRRAVLCLRPWAKLLLHTEQVISPMGETFTNRLFCASAERQQLCNKKFINPNSHTL